ncbi:xylulokinase [Pseudobutyrivibrio sp.]|uniref:xylulokinase n=1 Tax=Pseudobutyrivibrio sp. TaxID=2014367 RepID=UPI001DB0A11C|nr:FGGY-family carbohydrate kinase [Pseudobutyrivibrio sp.]MBE5911163.1 carbohydrate kinase [Pseudobutyrivibrio sp.]
MDLKESYLLGIDLGTTNVKGNIMNGEGKLIATASRSLGKIFPGQNMIEQDPERWWNSTISILKYMTALAGDEVVSKIKGISISSQCPTFLPLDENGVPVHNAIIYADGRAVAETDEITEKLGFEKFVNIVGGQPSVAFLPGKFLWFKRNLPDEFERTATIMQANSYLNYKLTGELTIDIDTASRTQLMNLSTLKWSKEIGDAIGVDLDSLMPPVKKCTDIIGTVTKAAAEQTGLAEGTPVVAGCSDAMASMYAIGLSKLGDAGESAGTSSLIFASAPRASASDVPVVTRPVGLETMPFVYDGPIGTTGAALRWYVEQMGEADIASSIEAGKNIYDYMNKVALTINPGSDGLYFFPYMAGGERAPIWNSHARGMFIGLNLTTDRAHIIRSIFEGTAFALRHVMDAIKDAGGVAENLRITGGGSKSMTWNKIKASMLHMPVYVLDDISGDVPFGDILLAGHAVGIYPDLSEAVTKMVKIKEVVEPIPEWEAAYDKLYPYYVEMYKHLDADLKGLQSTVTSLCS